MDSVNFKNIYRVNPRISPLKAYSFILFLNEKFIRVGLNNNNNLILTI